MCDTCYDDFIEIYQKEINNQNTINYISVSKTSPKIHLYMHNVLQKYHLTTMRYIESKDCHYPREKIYSCPQCGTCISSPLTPNEHSKYVLHARYIIAHKEMLEKIASGDLNTTNNLTRLFEYNVVNPKVIARKDALVFEDGWEEYLYWERDWKVIPTIQV